MSIVGDSFARGTADFQSPASCFPRAQPTPARLAGPPCSRVACRLDIGSTKQQVQPNDVLLCKIVPHINRVWVVPPPQNERRQIASSEWITVRNTKFYPNY